jgi:hypothetical protein
MFCDWPEGDGSASAAIVTMVTSSAKTNRKRAPSIVDPAFSLMTLPF